MASMVTNAGTGSGNDFESIISAMVSSRKQLLSKRVTVKKAETEIEQDGVKKLTSALKSFKSTIDNSKGIDVLNTHKISTSQSSSYTAFSITAKSDCSNTSMSVQVNQLAKAESITTKIKTNDESGEKVFNNSFSAGTLTISLGTIPVQKTPMVSAVMLSRLQMAILSPWLQARPVRIHRIFLFHFQVLKHQRDMTACLYSHLITIVM